MLDPRTRLMLHLCASEERMLRDISATQVTHPIAEYAPGSPRLERLYQQLEDAKRFTFPNSMEPNL